MLTVAFETKITTGTGTITTLVATEIGLIITTITITTVIKMNIGQIIIITAIYLQNMKITISEIETDNQ